MVVLICLAIKMVMTAGRKAVLIGASGVVLLLVFLISYNYHHQEPDRGLLSLPDISLEDLNPLKCPACPEACPIKPLERITFDVATMTSEQVVDYFYWTNASSCKLAHDIGGKMMHLPSGLDGQKAVCLDPGVAPKPGKDCLIYSFGINNEWSFDDLMEDYGCEVFAFDPSLGLKDHNRTAKIHFYSWGLADKDYVNEENQWTMKSLSTIYRELGHEGRIIDYLKMDIEGAEWAVLPQILSSGMLPKVRQLGAVFNLSSAETILEDFIHSHVIPVKALEDAGMVRFDSKAKIFWVGRIPALNNYLGPLGFEIAWYQLLPFGRIKT